MSRYGQGYPGQQPPYPTSSPQPASYPAYSQQQYPQQQQQYPQQQQQQYPPTQGYNQQQQYAQQQHAQQQQYPASTQAYNQQQAYSRPPVPPPQYAAPQQQYQQQSYGQPQQSYGQGYPNAGVRWLFSFFSDFLCFSLFYDSRSVSMFLWVFVFIWECWQLTDDSPTARTLPKDKDKDRDKHQETMRPHLAPHPAARLLTAEDTVLLQALPPVVPAVAQHPKSSTDTDRF
jgi:hypothetical protein